MSILVILYRHCKAKRNIYCSSKLEVSIRQCIMKFFGEILHIFIVFGIGYSSHSKLGINILFLRLEFIKYDLFRGIFLCGYILKYLMRYLVRYLISPLVALLYDNYLGRFVAILHQLSLSHLCTRTDL